MRFLRVWAKISGIQDKLVRPEPQRIETRFDLPNPMRQFYQPCTFRAALARATISLTWDAAVSASHGPIDECLIRKDRAIPSRSVL